MSGKESNVAEWVFQKRKRAGAGTDVFPEARNVGKVLTHTFITENVWGRSWENDVASLRVFMATLRKKVESKPDSPQYIQTHIGIGYRMMKVE